MNKKTWLLLIIIFFAGGTADLITTYAMLNLGYVETNYFRTPIPYVYPVFSLFLFGVNYKEVTHVEKRVWLKNGALGTLAVILICFNWYGATHNLALAYLGINI